MLPANFEIDSLKNREFGSPFTYELLPSSQFGGVFLRRGIQLDPQSVFFKLLFFPSICRMIVFSFKRSEFAAGLSFKSSMLTILADRATKIRNAKMKIFWRLIISFQNNKSTQASEVYNQLMIGIDHRNLPRGIPDAHEMLPPQIQVHPEEDNDLESLLATSRNNFVKKVYAMLSIQLVITACVVGLSFASQSFAAFQKQRPEVLMLTSVSSVCILLAIFCSDTLSKLFPYNLLLLFMFTICQSYVVSSICSLYEGSSVILAAIGTAGAMLSLTGYAFITKRDFTSWNHMAGAICTTFFWLIIIMSLFNVMAFQLPIFQLIETIFIALIYAVYIVVDTQMIIGGKKEMIQMDDWVKGVVMLYVDLIGLFLRLLQILGKRN